MRQLRAALFLLCFSLTLNGLRGQGEALKVGTKVGEAKDSLKRLIKRLDLHDLKRVDALNDYARIHRDFAPDTALKYSRKALKLASQLESPSGLGEAHLNLGIVSSSFGAYANAAEHLFSAIDAFSEAEDYLGLSKTHNALGDMYYYTRQLEEALQEHRTALEIARRHEFSGQEAMTFGYLGHFYEKQGDYEKALDYQLLALDKYRELKDYQGLSTINGNLGSIYEDLKSYDRAHEYFEEALEYNLQTPNQEERIVHLNNLGDVFRKKQQYEPALLYTRRSLALARQLDNPYRIRSAQRDLSKAFGEMGEYDSAYFHLEDAYLLHEKLFNSEGASHIARLQSLHETAKIQKEIEILKKDKKINRITWFSSLGALGMITLLLVIWESRQRLKVRKDKELAGARQALMTQELENSQLREQKLKSELEASSSELSSYALSIVQKNKMLKDIRTQLSHLRTQDKSLKAPISQLQRKIDEGFHFDKDWKKFHKIFEQVHPQFFKELNEQYPDLTPAEIRLCALLRLNLDSKDIATILGISPDSLRVARYRLRKKLQVEKGSNLMGFINAL